EIERSAGCCKFLEIPSAINEISAEHASEKHDFGAQEPPHAERRSVALLLDVGKVVSQFGAVLVFSVFENRWTIAQVSPLRAAASFHTSMVLRAQPGFRQS